MSDEATSRVWATPVHGAITKPRHKFGIDGRLLFCPVVVPTLLAIPFAHPFMQQIVLAGIGFVLWACAKVMWELNPYLLDDVAAELRAPRYLSDAPNGDPIR